MIGSIIASHHSTTGEWQHSVQSSFHPDWFNFFREIREFLIMKFAGTDAWVLQSLEFLSVYSRLSLSVTETLLGEPLCILNFQQTQCFRDYRPTEI